MAAKFGIWSVVTSHGLRGSEKTTAGGLKPRVAPRQPTGTTAIPGRLVLWPDTSGATLEPLEHENAHGFVLAPLEQAMGHFVVTKHVQTDAVEP